MVQYFGDGGALATEYDYVYVYVSDHYLAGHRVLIFNSLAFVKSLPHHENGVAVEAVLELDVGELTHRYTHRIL